MRQSNNKQLLHLRLGVVVVVVVEDGAAGQVSLAVELHSL